MIVSVLITERPDTDALHATLDTFGRNQVRWTGDSLEVEFAGDVDAPAVRAAVRAVGPTPNESDDDRRRRLIIESLSKADLVRAIIDPAARDALRLRITGQ